MTTRRGFLALAAAATATAKGGARVDRSRISAISDEIAASPLGAIGFARQYGLEWLELREVPGVRRAYTSLSDGELRAAAREFDDNGIKISFLNASLLKHMLPGTEPANPRHRESDATSRFAGRLDELRRALKAAHILGVDKVRVFAFLRVKDPASLMPRIAEIIAEMSEVAAKERIHLLVENEGSCNVATCGELAQLMRLLPSPWIGINWDPLNGTHFQEAPMPEGYAKLPKNRICNVQIKGKSIVPGSEKLDWPTIFGALTSDGYGGRFGLETHIFGEQLIHWSHVSMRAILEIVG